jgi:membrane protein implicated in regulation of membrane protease activity
MDMWVLFVIVGCVLGFGEIVSTGFYLAPFSLAAFIAAILDGVSGSSAASVITFIVVSILLFTFVRPIVRRVTQIPPLASTNTAALIGQRAIVLERIANDEGVGLVKIGGEVWTARTFDHEVVIAEGTAVQVLEIRGATALVTEF